MYAWKDCFVKTQKSIVDLQIDASPNVLKMDKANQLIKEGHVQVKVDIKI